MRQRFWERRPQAAPCGAAISPSKIILGTTTAGILGREGEVLKKLMPIAIGTTIVIGLVVFATAVL